MISMVFVATAQWDPLSMSNQTQISATISASTKLELDRFTRARGLKKNYVVEQALRLFIAARRALPDEALIPTRVVLEDAAFDDVVDLLESPPAPTDALRELLRGD